MPETIVISLMGTENGESIHRTDHLDKYGIYTGGKWLVKACTQLRVEYIAESYKAVKEDEEVLKINDEWIRSW